VANKKALAVVIRIDKPAGDVIGGTGANLAGGRIVHIHPFDGDCHFSIRQFLHRHVRLAEYHKQVADAGFFEQLASHLQIGVDTRWQHTQPAIAFDFLGNMRIKGKTQHYQQVKTDAGNGFFGGFLDLFRTDRTVFRAKRNSHTFDRTVLLAVFPAGLQPGPSERL